MAAAAAHAGVRSSPVQAGYLSVGSTWWAHGAKGYGLWGGGIGHPGWTHRNPDLDSYQKANINHNPNPKP